MHQTIFPMQKSDFSIFPSGITFSSSVSCAVNGFMPIPSTHCCKENNKVQLKDKETRMFLNSKARKEVRPALTGLSEVRHQLVGDKADRTYIYAEQS